MSTRTYRVECNNCNAADDVVIDQNRNIYWKQVKNIISGRYRLDMQWGWQCKCGNNDLITNQERQEISNLQAPDPVDIGRVLKDLIPDEPKFTMRTS